jgi:hypothetical protein
MNKTIRAGMVLRTKIEYTSTLIEDRDRLIRRDVFLLVVSDIYQKDSTFYLEVMLNGVVERWQRWTREDLYNAIAHHHEIIGE